MQKFKNAVEKVELNESWIRDLAESDLAISKEAQLLIDALEDSRT